MEFLSVAMIKYAEKKKREEEKDKEKDMEVFQLSSSKTERVNEKSSCCK